MKNVNDFMSLSDGLNPLSISEEMLGAYLEGNLSEQEQQLVEQAILQDENLAQLIDGIIEDISLKDEMDLVLGCGEFPDNSMTDDELLDRMNTLMKETRPMTLYGEEPLNQVSDYVRQSYPDTCAIKSQQLVLDSYGIHISEDQLRNEAIAHGWYVPGQGTPMADVGKLLELHGVGMHQYVNGNIYNVVNELALGHKVIMGVDSGELWNYGLWEKMEDRIPGIGGADHALIVSGINTSDTHNVKVIITDPGTGDLCKEYTLPQFVDAANDSNFYMVTTEKPVPNIFDSFGEGVEHLPLVGDMSYDYFRDHFAFLHKTEDSSVFDEFMAHFHVPATETSSAVNIDNLDSDSNESNGVGDSSSHCFIGANDEGTQNVDIDLADNDINEIDIDDIIDFDDIDDLDLDF